MSERCPSRLHAAECDQHGASIDVARDVIGLEPAGSKGNLANLVPLPRKEAPREVVRAVLALADHDVVPAARRAELGCHEAGSGGHRRDQRNIGGVGTDEGRGRGPRALASSLTADIVQRSLRPIVEEAAVAGNSL